MCLQKGREREGSRVGGGMGREWVRGEREGIHINITPIKFNDTPPLAMILSVLKFWTILQQ